MSLLKMTLRRVKTIMAWVLAVIIFGLLLLGTIYLAVQLGWI